VLQIITSARRRKEPPARWRECSRMMWRRARRRVRRGLSSTESYRLNEAAEGCNGRSTESEARSRGGNFHAGGGGGRALFPRVASEGISRRKPRARPGRGRGHGHKSSIRRPLKSIGIIRLAPPRTRTGGGEARANAWRSIPGAGALGRGTIRLRA